MPISYAVMGKHATWDAGSFVFKVVSQNKLRRRSSGSYGHGIQVAQAAAYPTRSMAIRFPLAKGAVPGLGI